MQDPAKPGTLILARNFAADRHANFAVTTALTLPFTTAPFTLAPPFQTEFRNHFSYLNLMY